MSQATKGTTGVVRVSVASGARRVDLVLPGSLPVAELLPELAGSVGLLDAATVHGGYRLMLPGGRVLAPDAGLIPQGVEDGAALSIIAGIDEARPRLYDDVVEAMADVSERDLAPWRPAAGRRTALLAAGVFLLLGAGALLAQGGQAAGTAAAAMAAALIGGAVALSRSGPDPGAGVVSGWLAATYAAVAGATLGHQSITCAGLGLLAAGVPTILGLGRSRALVLPELVVGAVLVGCGAARDTLGCRPAVLLSIVLVAVVVCGSVLPWLALATTRTYRHGLTCPAGVAVDPAPIDPDRVAADARIAHQILLGISTTVGVLLVIVAPLAVTLGLPGTLLAVAASLVVILRTRQHRAASEVLVGLVSGIVGLTAVALAALWLHPDWRPILAVFLAVTGGVVVALTGLPGMSLHRGRLGDLAEAACLVALLPLLMLAVGAVSRVSA